MQDAGAAKDKNGPHDGLPELRRIVLLLEVEEGLQRGVARLAAQPLGPAPQDGDLVGLAEAAEEDDLAAAGEGHAQEDDAAPAEGLGDGAADGRADGPADEGRHLHEAHRRPALLRREDVADDGRAQHVGRDREARQHAGGDEGPGAAARRRQDRAPHEEHVRPVDHGVPADDLRQGPDQQGAGRLAQLPDRHEEHAGRLARPR